jgi:hypothetical protein
LQRFQEDLAGNLQARQQHLPPGARHAPATSFLKQRALDLTDELLNNLTELNAFLPAQGENGMLPVSLPPDLTAKIQSIRDKLLKYMKDVGGYQVYQIEINDSVTKHQKNIDVKGHVSSSDVANGHVAQILLPGYETVRQGHIELKRKPQVKLAR